MTQHNLTQILKVIRDLVMRNRPCYRDYIGNGQYETKLLPEYLLPDFLRDNVVASKAEVQSAAAKATAASDAANTAQTTADAAQATANTAESAASTAQATANAKFQLLKQTTVTTTTTIGTVSNTAGPVSVKGLNIAVGSPIKFTADGNLSGTAVWNSAYISTYIRDAAGGMVCSLSLELSHDGETYVFANATTASTISNLVIEYEKVDIPKVVYPSRPSGAWLPPYLIANCIYLTKNNSVSSSATLYRITVDDTGTLTATEVT